MSNEIQLETLSRTVTSQGTTQIWESHSPYCEVRVTIKDYHVDTFLIPHVNDIIICYLGFHQGYAISTSIFLKKWMIFSSRCKREFCRFHPHLGSEDNWKTVCAMLQTSSHHLFTQRFKSLVYFATICENKNLLHLLKTLIFERNTDQMKLFWYPQWLAFCAQNPSILESEEWDSRLLDIHFQKELIHFAIQLNIPFFLYLLGHGMIQCTNVPMKDWSKIFLSCTIQLLSEFLPRFKEVIESKKSKLSTERKTSEEALGEKLLDHFQNLFVQLSANPLCSSFSLENSISSQPLSSDSLFVVPWYESILVGDNFDLESQRLYSWKNINKNVNNGDSDGNDDDDDEEEE